MCESVVIPGRYYHNPIAAITNLRFLINLCSLSCQNENPIDSKKISNCVTVHRPPKPPARLAAALTTLAGTHAAQVSCNGGVANCAGRAGITWRQHPRSARRFSSTFCRVAGGPRAATRVAGAEHVLEGEEVPVGRAPKDEVGEALGARGGGRRLRVEPGGNGGSEPGCVRLQAGALCVERDRDCLLYTSPSPRDRNVSRMPSSA